MKPLLLLSSFILLANIFDVAAQETPLTLLACDDQISWCDMQGNTVLPTPAEIKQQCELYPSSCRNGEPIELADSGCVDTNGWLNYCTDAGKLREPTPAEIEESNIGNSPCTETTSGLLNKCQ
jgi:hypothetical protein